jgi:hypothetical protein
LEARPGAAAQSPVPAAASAFPPRTARIPARRPGCCPAPRQGPPRGARLRQRRRRRAARGPRLAGRGPRAPGAGARGKPGRGPAPGSALAGLAGRGPAPASAGGPCRCAQAQATQARAHTCRQATIYNRAGYPKQVPGRPREHPGPRPHLAAWRRRACPPTASSSSRCRAGRTLPGRRANGGPPVSCGCGLVARPHTLVRGGSRNHARLQAQKQPSPRAPPAAASLTNGVLRRQAGRVPQRVGVQGGALLLVGGKGADGRALGTLRGLLKSPLVPPGGRGKGGRERAARTVRSRRALRAACPAGHATRGGGVAPPAATSRCPARRSSSSLVQEPAKRMSGRAFTKRCQSQLRPAMHLQPVGAGSSEQGDAHAGTPPQPCLQPT